MKKSTLLFCSIVLIAASCSVSSVDEKPSSSSKEEKIEIKKEIAIVLPKNYYQRFEGTIGDYPITMEFIKLDSVIKGSYYYNKVKTPLYLSGTLGNDSIISFNEVSPSNKTTGKFSGKITDGDRFIGTWTNPKTKKELEFNLTAQPGQIKKFRTKTKAEKNCYPLTEDEYAAFSDNGDTICSDISLQHIFVECENPKIERAIQKVIETETCHSFGEASSYTEMFEMLQETDQDDGFTADIKCSVSSIYKNFLSIDISCYAYAHYTAHPSMFTAILNFDMNTGEQVSIEDLIKGNSMKAFKKEVQTLFEQENGGEDEGWYYPDEEFTFAKYFSILPNGIHFYYNQYEIGSYAQGMPDVFVPFSKIKNMLKQDWD